MSRLPTGPASLRDVLVAAALAPGNRDRFLQAGLMDQAGMLVADWQSAFLQLKPLTKAELRSQPGQFLAQATDIVFRGKTSGTQGEAFTYFAGASWNQKRLEARLQSFERWGLEANCPILNLASRLFPVRLQDSSLVGNIDETFLQTLLHLLKAEPRILRGYPSRLCEVAIALHHTQNASNLPPVVAVIATGECLFEFQRALLSQTFQAPIINEYGCQESGISGLSCAEAGRLHLDSERCLYEIVAGQLLTTDLYNLAMPMVRYSSGDVLKLFPEPCPCGQPGLTAQVLGRQEEAIAINGQRCWPGAFDLPSFPTILGYQIQIDPDRYRLWVQPSLDVIQPDLNPLQDWMTTTLGAKTTEVLIESPFASSTPGFQRAYLNTVEDTTWLQQVIRQPWSHWLNHPLPVGEAHDIAALLQQLASPRLIMLQGLPPQMLKLIRTLMHSEVAGNRNLEAMKIRALLWAVGLMAGSQRESHQSYQSYQSQRSEVKDFYQKLLQRFQHWAGNQRSTERDQAASLGLDLLAPLLTLDTQTALEWWPSVCVLIQHFWPQGLRADRLTLHHYLTILDEAGQIAQRQVHPWVPALRPLAAVLQGDLSHFTTTLNQDLIATWATIIHNCPDAFTQEQATIDFRSVWQAERRALLQQDRATVSYYLSRLRSLAQSPSQIAQCWLERGYAALVFEEPLDPVEWTAVLQQQMGLTEQPTSSQPQPSVSNPTPWLPILNALAPKFIEMGKPDLAYACLFAAAPPNRHLSNLNRQTQDCNGKQSVIGAGRTAP